MDENDLAASNIINSVLTPCLLRMLAMKGLILVEDIAELYEDALMQLEQNEIRAPELAAPIQRARAMLEARRASGGAA